jgi:hypothetical protein
MVDDKAMLHEYLQLARDAMVWKLDGVSEYDVRRPLTPTGTNLLGLVKHLASVELGYFGATFGRPSDEPLPWHAEDAEPNADMWATPDESRADILGLYERARAHADGTIEAIALDDTGNVAWWPEHRNPVTLHGIMVHLIAETNRHVGHADILRESIDRSVGHRAEVANLPEMAPDDWSAHRDRLEAAAVEAQQRYG